MTADKGTAIRYGGHVLELHAKIDKPYFVTDTDLMGINSVEAANRLRSKLKADGYDGAVLSAPGNPTESPDFRFSRAALQYYDYAVIDEKASAGLHESQQPKPEELHGLKQFPNQDCRLCCR